MQTPVFDGVIYDHNNQYEMDSRLFVQFFVQAIQNNFKSEQQGRPIFDEVEMVRIMTPGSRDVFVGKATYQYQARFPKQYAAFKAGKEQPMEGTPLEEVPFLSVGQVAELKAINVRTLEQLAHMPDNLAQQIMGNFGLRQKAQNFLAIAKDQAPFTKMEAELAKRDNEIEILKEQLAKLVANAPKPPASPPVVMPAPQKA